MMRAIRVELFDRNLDKQCMEQDRIWRATAHGISMPARRRAILTVKHYWCNKTSFEMGWSLGRGPTKSWVLFIILIGK